MIVVLLSTTYLAACENLTKTHIYVYIIKFLTQFSVFQVIRYVQLYLSRSISTNWIQSVKIFGSVDSFTENIPTWYMDQPFGKNTLGNMLKPICTQSGLNDIYTNHSLRATSITVLDLNKCESRDIIAVSGQRSESSLENYRKKSSKTRMQSWDEYRSYFCSYWWCR